MTARCCSHSASSRRSATCAGRDRAPPRAGAGTRAPAWCRDRSRSGPRHRPGRPSPACVTRAASSSTSAGIASSPRASGSPAGSMPASLSPRVMRSRSAASIWPSAAAAATMARRNRSASSSVWDTGWKAEPSGTSRVWKVSRGSGAPDGAAWPGRGAARRAPARRDVEQRLAGLRVLPGLVGEPADHREAAELGEAARTPAAPCASAEQEARQGRSRPPGRGRDSARARPSAFWSSWSGDWPVTAARPGRPGGRGRRRPGRRGGPAARLAGLPCGAAGWPTWAAAPTRASSSSLRVEHVISSGRWLAGGPASLAKGKTRPAPNGSTPQAGRLPGEAPDRAEIALRDRLRGGDPGAADAGDVRQGEIGRRVLQIDAAGRAEGRPGSGPRTALSQAAPPDAAAGKNFSASKPSRREASSPPTAVAQPGITGIGASARASASSRGVPGVTMNLAPASDHLGDLARAGPPCRRRRPRPAPPWRSPRWRRAPRACAG